jgi:nucleoporin NUP159
LDTINRTYRNIDTAIARQMEDINKLSSRMSKLDLKSFQKSKPFSTRDKRLPDRSNKGGKAVNITSSIAATAATTLNAERSAYKLKKVLLNYRDKPLLNAKASTTASTRVEFKTPQKLDGGLFNSASGTLMTPRPPPPIAFPTTTSPSPSSISGGNRRAKHHAKSAWSSKKPEGESSPSPAPATFDWGPPPPSVGGQKTLTSLPFSLSFPTPPPGSNDKLPSLPFGLR